MAPSRDNSPSAYQEMFVNELRARREASGLSRNKLAAALGCTPQWIAKVETFEKPPSEGLSDDLDTYFQLGGAFRRMWEKHMEARKRGLIPSGFRPLAEAQPEASQFSIFAPLLIPGLLQTEEHARLVFEAEQRADKAEELLALRMERQALLAKTDPPLLFLLIREAVLRDLHGEIKEGQCKRLLDMFGEAEFLHPGHPLPGPRLPRRRVPSALVQRGLRRGVRGWCGWQRTNDHASRGSAQTHRTLQ